MGFWRVLFWPLKKRQLRTLRTRVGLNRFEFSECFSDDIFQKQVAGMVWDHVQPFIVVDEFLPSPEDDIRKIYGIDEEELDEDLILTLLERLSIPVPEKAEVSKFGEIKTLRDVIMFISFSHQISRSTKTYA